MKTIKWVSALWLAALTAPVLAQDGDDSHLRSGLVFQDTENNAYKVKLGFRLQPLFTTNFRDFERFDDPSLIQSQFQVRRARIKLDGFLGSPNWVYKIELALGNRNLGGTDEHTSFGARLILDAAIKYQIDGGRYSIWFGQTKLPGNRERVVSSQKLQFVDRHIVNSRFNLDRDIGVQFHAKENWFNTPWKWAVALSQGEGRNITDQNAGGFEYTGRLEWLPLGNFKNKGDYVEADIYREETLKLSLGLTYDFNDRAVRTRANQGSWMEDANGDLYYRDMQTWMFDAIAKYRGWSMLYEWADRAIDNPVVLDGSGNLVGAFYGGKGHSAQLGYVFQSNWELAGRYSVVQPQAGSSSTGDYEQYTLGVSRYIRGHNIKVQSDLTFTNYINGGSDPLTFRFQVEVGI